MIKSNKSSEYVLGMMSTGRALHAILLQDGPDGPEVVRRFSRQRAAGGAALAAPQPAAAGMGGDGEAESYGQDFTIQFGGGEAGGGKDLFLSSEFAGLEAAGEEDLDAAPRVVTFEMELADIFEECRNAGYDNPSVAFALSAADVAYAEVRLPGGAKAKKLDHAGLVAVLDEQHKGAHDPERVFFLPMTPGEEGAVRYLAVFPKPSDPVTATLRVMRDQKERMPGVRLLDAEVPLYVGLARAAEAHLRAAAENAEDGLDFAPAAGTLNLPEGAPLNTLVVRAGFEETLVLFLQDGIVQHCESLRSLTAFDAPETVCSRVLLQQDEHGVGDVHHVLLLSEEREGELKETFEMFFPDAHVESLRAQLPRLDDGTYNGTTSSAVALASALRLFDDPYYDVHFEAVNFLPKRLLKRKVTLPFNWHVASLSVLIILTSLFFVTSFASGENEIGYYRERLAQYNDPNTKASLDVMQAQIDSMQNMHAMYTRALHVLDTLLVGSDKWSRTMELTAREARAVKGLWIESMSPNGSRMTLIGSATSRDRVVEFARRTDAVIESLTFSEIRTWPVYAFTMQMPIREQLPEAALYLRRQAALTLNQDGGP